MSGPLQGHRRSARLLPRPAQVLALRVAAAAAVQDHPAALGRGLVRSGLDLGRVVGAGRHGDLRLVHVGGRAPGVGGGQAEGEDRVVDELRGGVEGRRGRVGSLQGHRGSGGLGPGEGQGLALGIDARPGERHRASSSTVWSGPASAVGGSLGPAVTVTRTSSTSEAAPLASVAVRPKVSARSSTRLLRGLEGRRGGIGPLQGHRRPVRLGPGEGQGLALGIGARPGERHRGQFLDGLVGSGVGGGGIVGAGRHGDLHLVRVGGRAPGVGGGQGEGEHGVVDELRGGLEGRGGRVGPLQGHRLPGGLLPGEGQGLALGIGARPGERHRGQFLDGLVGSGVGRGRVVDAGRHRDPHGVRGRGQPPRVGHGQAEGQRNVRGQLRRRLEGRRRGVGALQGHRRAAALLPGIGQGLALRVAAGAAVQGHLGPLVHGLVVSGVGRGRIVGPRNDRDPHLVRGRDPGGVGHREAEGQQGVRGQLRRRREGRGGRVGRLQSHRRPRGLSPGRSSAPGPRPGGCWRGRRDAPGPPRPRSGPLRRRPPGAGAGEVPPPGPAMSHPPASAAAAGPAASPAGTR